MTHESAEVLEEHRATSQALRNTWCDREECFHESKPHQKVKMSVFNLSKHYEHFFFNFLIIVMYFRVTLRGEQLTT